MSATSKNESEAAMWEVVESSKERKIQKNVNARRQKRKSAAEHRMGVDEVMCK